MDSFPAGLRVLVVDDDLTWLKILEKMLRKCSYEVTTCCSATSALVMLRERKDKFDIVISDVNMPDMDGFKLLEHVGLEMDLPVIMMSVDGEISRVMKGVQHGACDYLLKPVRMKELRNIWQHVFRKKIHEMKENESHDHESNEGTHMLKNGFDEFEDDFFLCAIDPNSTKKRKDSGSEEDNDQEFNSNPGTVKKARVVWSVDLHQKFVNAVNQIGFDKVGPKKILDLMNIPGLTRENVASHLQKYRLYLSRIQKQNEPNTSFCGIKSSTATHHNSSNSFTYSNNKSCVQDMGNELKGIVSFLPVKEAKNFWRDDGSDVQKLNTVPQIDAVLPFGIMIPNANCKPYGSSVSHQQTWSGKSSVVPLEQHVEQDHETHLPCEAYPHLLLHGHQNHSQVDCPQPITSGNTRTYITDKDKSGLSEIKPFYTDHKSNRVGSVSPRASRTDPFSSQLNHEYANPQVFGAVPVSSASSSSTKHDLDRNCINSWGSLQSLTLKNDSLSASSLEDLQLRSIQGYGSYDGVWHDTLEFIETSDSSSINELQSYVHDGLRFNCGYQDSTEYPVIEEGVFIT